MAGIRNRPERLWEALEVETITDSGRAHLPLNPDRLSAQQLGEGIERDRVRVHWGKTDQVCTDQGIRLEVPQQDRKIHKG